MNRPSNRRQLWSWLPVAFSCCGLFFVGGEVSRTRAQDKPNVGQVEPPAAEPASPAARPPNAAAPAAKPNSAPEFLPRPVPNEQKILDALGNSTEVAFVDIPLTEALSYLKEIHSIELWLDKEALSAEGIATDQLLSLQLSGLTLRSALRLLLEPLHLTYVIEDEVMKITTRTAAGKLLVTRTYPAGDLFDTPQEAIELVDVIMSGLGLGPEAKGAMPHNMLVPQFGTASAAIKTLTVGLNAPQEDKSGAAPKKGAGTIAVSFKARALVARQPHAVHDEILQLLRDLREAKTFAPAGPAHVMGRFADPNSLPTYGPTPGALTPSNPTPLDEFSPGTPNFAPSRNRVPATRYDDDSAPFDSPPKTTPVPTKTKPVR